MPFPQQVISKTLLNDNTNDIDIEQNLVLHIFQPSGTSNVLVFGNDDGSGDCDWRSSWLVP